MSKGFASNYRIVLLGSGIVLCFGILAVRLIDLHVFADSSRLRSAARARNLTVPVAAQRGEIRDALGNRLAMNVEEWQFGVDPQSLRPADESKWPELARLLDLPTEEVERTFRLKVRLPANPATPAAGPEAAPEPIRLRPVPPSAPVAEPVVAEVPAPVEVATPAPVVKEPTVIRWAKLGDPVSLTVHDQIMALGIKGVYANQAYRRVYTQKQFAAHLIGYVNKEFKPVAGIEAAYDYYLRGLNGWKESERDGRARELAQFRSLEVAPRDGYNLTLSLDSGVQKFVEDELGAIARQFNPEGATIIVSDARTGFLLALGNYPTFDPNEYNLVPPDRQASMKNIAVTNQIEPGSTFKIVAAAGAINEGLVRSDTRFDTTKPTILFEGRERKFMEDDHRSEEPMSVAAIIAQSSNNGAAQLGMRLGQERLYAYARAFGFGERSELGFGGEISGTLNPWEKWRGNDITRIPAGYSVAATPMQIHYAMGTIASGGLLLQPQVVQEIRDPAGKTIFTAGLAARRRVLSQETARTMARLLMGVAAPGGTAAKAAIDGYQVAGKTGTAQKLVNGIYSKTNHVASFTGFFPATDPRVVVTVIVDDAKVPNGGTAYGSVVAVPAFKHLAEKLISYLNIRQPGGMPRAGQAFALQGGGR